MLHEFENMTLPELLEVIVSGDERSDEAMWYVLHERVSRELRLQYQKYKESLWDTYDDLVSDFFLYLKDGKSTEYQSLSSIKAKEAFDKWLVGTWRNYLCMRKERDDMNVLYDNDVAESVDDDTLTDERKIEIASQVIAYCDQVFTPKGRFIFLRTMLTLLDKQNALPEKEMAEALGMSDVGYRVTSHRLRADARCFMEELLRNERIELDEEHRKMSERISNGFDGLYDVLMTTYEDVLKTLSQRDEVMSLRLALARSDGMMLHEEVCQMGIKVFWNRLRKVLSYDFLRQFACERFLNDARYREGHLHILAAAEGTEVIGLHTPEMKKIAKEIARSDNWRETLTQFASHKPLKGKGGLSHDERSIWGLVIDYAKCSLRERTRLIDGFIESIDSWAICDTFCCNSAWAKKEDKESFWQYIAGLLHSGKEWSVRVGVVLAMCHYLDNENIERTFAEIDSIGLHENEPYYVRMGIAWLLATALAKDEERTRRFVRNSTLPPDIIKLYVRKARESFRTRNIEAIC